MTAASSSSREAAGPEASTSATAAVSAAAGAPACAPDAEGRHARTLSWSSIAKSLVAGGIAGGVSRTAVAPLERLKILMQVQGNERVYTGVWQERCDARSVVLERPMSTITQVGLVRMVKAEGVTGCFKGNWTNCVRIIPNSAVKFLLYEQAVRSLSHASLDAGGDGRLGPIARLGAGAAAGIVAMSATYPLDMVRGRLTVQGGAGGGGSAAAQAASTSSSPAGTTAPATTAQYRGIAHAARTIVAEEGLVALWRGWLPSVIGVIPYVGLNFCVYESLKDAVLRYSGGNDEREIPVTTRLACGALAGTTGQTIAFPLDVVRRRMQMSGWAGAAALHGADPSHSQAIAYRGMTDCFARTVREEGVRALFKGLWPNYIKVVPSIAIAFVSYEQLKEAMGVQLRISS